MELTLKNWVKIKSYGKQTANHKHSNNKTSLLEATA